MTRTEALPEDPPYCTVYKSCTALYERSESLAWTTEEKAISRPTINSSSYQLSERYPPNKFITALAGLGVDGLTTLPVLDEIWRRLPFMPSAPKVRVGGWIFFRLN